MNADQNFQDSTSKQERIPVLLVDDHTSIRQMLAFMLPREGPYDIVGQVSTGPQAIEQCRALQPKLVVLDLLLPEMSGVEVVRQLRQESRETRTLVYSGTSSTDLIAEAMSARPHGFVHKEDTLQVFREALRAVTAGGNYFTQMAAGSAERANTSRLSILTDRERVVLQLVAEGRTNKEIAERLSMAVKTVETHRSNLYNKLDIHDIASLTRFAVRHGLVPVDWVFRDSLSALPQAPAESHFRYACECVRRSDLYKKVFGHIAPTAVAIPVRASTKILSQLH